MASFLVDTDVFVDHLRSAQRIPVPPLDSAYSTITRAELYAGRGTDEGRVDLLLGVFEEVPVSREIAEEAGRIRRTVGIAMPDALIAATALTNRCVLVTRNARDFSRVPGLKMH